MIPYYLFKNKNQRKIRNNSYQKVFFQLAKIYANRYHNATKDVCYYVYFSQSEKPTEVIEPINANFFYEYLFKNRPDVLTTKKGRIISISEYKAIIDEYFVEVNQRLYDGLPVNLPHFLGIIKPIQIEIKKYNKLAKKKLRKKIIILQWENKYFVKRLTNLIDPNWISIKIRDKKLISDMYLRAMTESYRYSITYDQMVRFSKKIR